MAEELLVDVTRVAEMRALEKTEVRTFLPLW
jgi:hypothetical protein